jgi:hypothetical protein
MGGAALHLLLLFFLISFMGGEGFGLSGHCFRRTFIVGAALGLLDSSNLLYLTPLNPQPPQTFPSTDIAPYQNHRYTPNRYDRLS